MASPDISPLRRSALWRMGKARRNALADILRRRLTRRLTQGGHPFRVLVLIGQKRSGNHVFLNWYMSQCGGASLLFNNVSPDQVPTERRRQELRLNGIGAVLQTPPTLIFSYEDHTPEAVLTGSLKGFLVRHNAQITDLKLAMVMRDPRNLMASRLQKWPEEFDVPDRMAEVRARYVATADLMLSPPAELQGHSFVPVLYNGLVSSASYQDGLSDCLGIARGTKGLDQVASYGYGSSFDGEDKSGKAQEMQVFRRWERFQDDPRFQAMFADDGLSRLIDRFEARVKKVLAR